MKTIEEINREIAKIEERLDKVEGTPTEVLTAHNIKEVYGADGCVYAHPVNGLPIVLLNPGNNKSTRPEGGIV